MGEAIAFYTLAALILGFAVLVVTARETVHSVLFLVATFPRYRYDQLMRLGWKWLIPLAILNVVVTGLVKVLV